MFSKQEAQLPVQSISIAPGHEASHIETVVPVAIFF